AVDRSRTILPELPSTVSAADPEKWGREALQQFVTELQIKSADIIGQLGNDERIRRAVNRALAHRDAGEVVQACQAVDYCLSLCADRQRLHAELLSSDQIRSAALQPLAVLLPDWRRRQGVTPTPPK
ncbi:MAG: hypothetical protein ACK5YO_31585, partial [Planctomyces sp.]